MRGRVKIGDIFEIPTSKGLAYMQYTHQHKKWGGVIRVLEGFYESTPSYEELKELTQHSHRFTILFPVRVAINRGVFKVVANYQIPEFAQEFPIFKNGTPDPKTKKVKNWWLWDGEKEWKVGELSEEEQQKHPFFLLCNDTALIYHIETGLSAGRKLC